MSNLRTLVIIPAYNEALNIEKTVHDIIENAPQVDYVVVNDGSKDNTLEVCRKNHFHTIDGFCNLGLFGAVQTGFKLAMEQNYDVAIQFDGDGQHSATYIPALVEEIEKGNQIVIGSRFVTEKKPWTARMAGSRLIAGAIKLTTGKIIKENARAKANRKYESTKTKITVRIDSDFREKVNSYAESKGMSVNQLICQHPIHGNRSILPVTNCFVIQEQPIIHLLIPQKILIGYLNSHLHHL